MRPAAHLSDAELMAEIAALRQLDDADAKTSPARLLQHLTTDRGALRYRRSPHLDVISDAVVAVADQYDSGTLDGPRLIIEEPPQTGKTYTGVVGTAFWWLVRNPAARIIIGSYSDGLANVRGRDIRNLVRDYGDRYGLTISRGSASVKDWILESGGGVKSVGVGAGITGSPGDLIIIDDPHKSRAEAESITIRDRVYDWYSADITSRLSPGAPLIIVMTPWHEDDLIARVTADEGTTDSGGRWRVVRMPAYCDDPDRDPLGRKYGEPLTHPKIRPGPGHKQRLTAHWEARRHSSTARDWTSLYMCDPKPITGALVSADILRQRRCYQHGSPSGPCCTDRTRVGIGVDPAGGGRDMVGIIAGYIGTDGRLYYTHDRSEVAPSDVWPRTVCELAIDVDADVIVFENNYGGDMAMTVIRTAWHVMVREAAETLKAKVKAVLSDRSKTADQRKELAAEARAEIRRYQRPCPLIKSVNARRSKVLRAEPVAQQIIGDLIRFGAYLPEFEMEWSSWQPGQPYSPGRIDAGVHLATLMLRPPPGAGDQPRGNVAVSLPVSSPTPFGQGIGGAASISPLA